LYQPCHCPRRQGIDDVEFFCIIDLIMLCHLTSGNIYIKSGPIYSNWNVDPLCCSQDHVVSTLKCFTCSKIE
ncbi:unnamed protein product, partial [Musa acuminata var. zebrina]